MLKADKRLRRVRKFAMRMRIVRLLNIRRACKFVNLRVTQRLWRVALDLEQASLTAIKRLHV